MKVIIKKLLIIGACLFGVPFFMIYLSGYKSGELLEQITAHKETQQQVQEDTLIDETQIIPILAKAMPYTYEEEAIKAQAVIIRTYMARKSLGIQANVKLSAYTDEEMRKLWQEDYDEIYASYKEAVTSTADEMIWYNGEPIQALYHLGNSGMTRSAKDVYDVEVPYLLSVQSQENVVSQQVKLSKEDIVSKLKEKYEAIIVDAAHLENQIQIIEKDAAGYTKSIQVGNMTFKGEEFRNLLGLASSNFKIYTASESLIFDVKGSGYGVGLSQNGANEMAKAGKSYQEIIEHYYSNIEIKKYH